MPSDTLPRVLPDVPSDVVPNTLPDLDLPALQAIGLGAAQRAQLAHGVADPLARPWRLAEVQRNHLLLHDGHQPRRARCSTALQQDLAAQGDSLAVGDWVLARPAPGAGADGVQLVTCRLPPVNQLSRRNSGGRGQDHRGGVHRQALVSNIDLAVLVMGLDHDFHLRRLERYLALVRLAGVDGLLVLSKADTVPVALTARRLAEASALLPPGWPAQALDLRQPAAAEALARWLRPGCTAVLLGSSGAGKSTLANTLSAAQALPAARDTGPVRSDDSRGRHTTTVRSLLPLPGGACLIDTPGLRALRLDVDHADALADAFGDVARLAPMCRFRDCQHAQEPGCAVRQAVDAPRLDNFHKLLREARRDQRSALERIEQRSEWKRRRRGAQARLREKRGLDSAPPHG